MIPSPIWVNGPSRRLTRSSIKRRETELGNTSAGKRASILTGKNGKESLLSFNHPIRVKAWLQEQKLDNEENMGKTFYPPKNLLPKSKQNKGKTYKKRRI